MFEEWKSISKVIGEYKNALYRNFLMPVLMIQASLFIFVSLTLKKNKKFSSTFFCCLSQRKKKNNKNINNKKISLYFHFFFYCER
jgi:hypothetical protein